MPFSNPIKNEQGHWVVDYTPDGAQASKTLATYQKYLDGNIILNASAATAVTYGNTPASGKTAASYTDISSTAPVLVSGDYLYINTGYTGDTKISLAKLVPEGSDVKGHAEYILSGHSAYDNDGVLVSGSIEIDTRSTFTTNSPSIDTIATIVPVSTSPSDHGAAINYNTTSGLNNYVTITAQSSGQNASGSTTSMNVGTKYMQNNVVITVPNPSVGENTSDTNYIKASLGGTPTIAAVTNTATAIASATAEITGGEDDYFLPASTSTGDFPVEFSATADATAKANSSDGATTTLSVKDTYMLNDIIVSSKGGSEATDTDQDIDAVTRYLIPGVLSNGTATFSGGAATSTTTIVAYDNLTYHAVDGGAAKNYDSSSNLQHYVSITANGTGGANSITASGNTGVSTSGWVTLGQSASFSGLKNAVSTSSTDTNYIAADNTSSISSNAPNVSASVTVEVTATAGATATASGSTRTADEQYFSNASAYPIQFTATANATATADATAIASGTASSTANGYTSLQVRDKYMLNNVRIDSTDSTGSINASGEATRNTATDSKSQTITKYIKSGSATPSVTVAGSASALSSPTAMNNQYFTITPNATVDTAGWIASISNGTQSKYKVKDGSAALSTSSITINNFIVDTDPLEGKVYISVDNNHPATVTLSASVTPGWISTIADTVTTVAINGLCELDLYMGDVDSDNT